MNSQKTEYKKHMSTPTSHKSFIAVDPESGTTYRFNETDWGEKKSRFMEKYPKAEVMEYDTYKPEDTQETDNIYASTSDGAYSFTPAEWEEKQEKFMQKFPDAQIGRLRGVDYWEEEKAGLQQEIDDFNSQYKSFIDEYEARQKGETVANVVSGGMGNTSDYLSDNLVEYNLRKQEQEALQERYHNSPAVQQQRENEINSVKELYQSVKAQASQEYEKAYERAKADRPLSLMDGIDNYVGAMADTPMYTAALNMLQKAQDTLEAPSKYDDSNGFVNFMKGAGHTFGSADFWSAGLTAINDNVKARQPFKRLEKKYGTINLEDLTPEQIDEALTPAEKAMVVAYTKKALADFSRAEDMSLGYQSGQVAAESLGFMAQFLLTGGVTSAAAKGATSGLAKWLAKNVGNAMVKKAAPGIMKLGAKALQQGGKFALGTTRSLIDAAVRTGMTTTLPRSISEYALPNLEQGTLPSANEYILKGLGDAFIENWSEAYGNVLGKLVSTPATAMFGKWGKAIARSPFMKGMERAGFHGYLTEIGEEWFGSAMRTLTGVDPDAYKNFWEKDNLIVTATSFAPMTLIGGGVSMSQRMAAGIDIENKADELRLALEKVGMNMDEIDALVDYRQQLSPQMLSDRFKPVVERIANTVDKETAKEVRKAAVGFSNAVARYQAFEGAYAEQEKIDNAELRDEMTAQMGGNRFWNTRQSNVVNEEGEAYEFEEVRLINRVDGSRFFIVGQEGDQLATIDEKGNHGVMSAEELDVMFNAGLITSDRTMNLDQFLAEERIARRRELEAQRMSEERTAQINELRISHPKGTAINLGTRVNPIITKVEEYTPNGVVVATNDKTTPYMNISYEQFAQAVGSPIRVLTDEQIAAEEAAAIEAQRAEKETKNAETPQDMEVAEDSANSAAELEQEAAPSIVPTNEDGSVNEQKFLEENPEEYVAWNDAQRQDGGADSMEQLEMLIPVYQAKYDESAKAWAASAADPVARRAAKDSMAEWKEKINRISNLLGKYSTPAQEEKTMAERTIQEELEDLHDGSLNDAEIASNIDAHIAEAQAAYDEYAKNAPVMGTDRSAYKKAKAEYEAGLKELGQELNYWNAVKSANETYGQITSSEEVAQFRAEAAEANKELMRQKARELEQKLGVKVNVIERYEDIRNKSAKAAIAKGEVIYGWYNADADVVEIYLPANISADTIETTYIHEVVGHKGLRGLLGKNHDALLDTVYEWMEKNLNKEQLDSWLKYEGVNGDKRKAADEYLADLAENVNYEDNLTLWDKIVSKIKNILRRLGIEVNMDEKDFVNLIKRSYENLAKEAKRQGISENSVTPETLENGTSLFSVKTYREGGREYLDMWLQSDNTISEEERKYILDTMDFMYNAAEGLAEKYSAFGAWSEADVVRDAKGDPIMSVIKANGDYAMNLDFSLVCKKRRALNALLNKMIKDGRFDGMVLREKEIARINQILQKHGFEVACALCFVDAKRYRVASVATQFTSMYNDLVKSLIPKGSGYEALWYNYMQEPNQSEEDARKNPETVISNLPDEALDWTRIDKILKRAEGKKQLNVEEKIAKLLKSRAGYRRLASASDFISDQGFELVTKNNPELLKLYNAKKGTGGPKASLGDVQYLNNIAKSQAFSAEKAYKVGGVRIQSFSDYMPHMFFDYMQMMAELAGKRLPAHAYTKEPAFARLFGMTGMKINLSLVPRVDMDGIAPGLDAEGNYTWAVEYVDEEGRTIATQTFPPEVAFEMQQDPRYSGNVGAIAVGISDEHILKMLGDPNIHFVIPYHKSSLNPDVAKMAKIDQYSDYTNYQTEKLDPSHPNAPKGKLTATQKKAEIAKRAFDFYSSLAETRDPKKTAEAYLAHCKEVGLIPKFPQFANNENYYKLLVDFNTYDFVTGEYAPQVAVTMTFPDNMLELIEEGLVEDQQLDDKLNAEIGEVAEEVYEEIGTTMFKTRITPEQDAAYLKAVEAGDMETAQRMVIEAAKLAMPNTKVVDEDGNPKVVYHGTNLSAVNKGVPFWSFYEDQHFGTKAQAEEMARAGKPDAVRKVYSVFLNVPNIKRVKDAPQDWTKTHSEYWEPIFDEAKQEGYDGLVYVNEWEDSDNKNDSYVVFSPSQIKSAEPVTYDNDGNVIPLSERFNEENEDIRFKAANKNQRIFISNAAKAVEGIQMGKATPEQWLKMLEKNGGLKAGEDKWLGLSDWLKASDKKSITKEELLQFINENMIQIEEVHYGEIEDEDAENAFYDNMIAAYGQDFYDRFVGNAFIFEDGYRGERWRISIYDDAEAIALYEEMTGDDVTYEENGDIDVESADKIIAWATDFAKKMEAVDEVRQINPTRLNYTTEGLENKHEIALTVPTIVSWNEGDKMHFGDAGDGRAVAWIRFGKTTTESGEKVLVIDEIQSKRHQEGRERGYQEEISQERLDEIAKRYDEVEERSSDFYHMLSEKYGRDYSDDMLSEEDKAAKEKLDNEFEVAANEYSRYFSPEMEGSILAVPPAPFEKNWHELAMKRMLRYAAENGYDVVAWTKGEQQSERYNIAKVVKDIYVAASNVERYVSIKTIRGDAIEVPTEPNSDVIVSGDYKGQRLSDVVGKELADKILSVPEGTDDYISGDGLKVGGEGMKGFYDKMLPAFMNKYGKKWGVKVEDIHLNLESGLDMHSVPVTEEMKESVMEGQTMFKVSTANDKTGSTGQISEGVFSATLFRMSKNTRQTINTWMDKREGLSDDVKIAVLDFIDQYNDSTLQLAMGKWFVQNTIRLPEDAEKCIQAVAAAKKARVDALSFSSPMEIINTYGIVKSKKKPINPDTVPTLKKVRELDGGLVIYDVEESEESRKNMREIINTHYGESCSPWCLLQGDGQGNLTEQSAEYWKKYSAYPKQVVFLNGKLLAFSANDTFKRVWWDRMDAPYDGIPLVVKLEDGRKVIDLVNRRTGKATRTSEVFSEERKGHVRISKKWDGVDGKLIEYERREGAKRVAVVESYSKKEMGSLGYWPLGKPSGLSYVSLGDMWIAFDRKGNVLSYVSDGLNVGRESGKQWEVSLREGGEMKAYIIKRKGKGFTYHNGSTNEVVDASDVPGRIVEFFSRSKESFMEEAGQMIESMGISQAELNGTSAQEEQTMFKAKHPQEFTRQFMEGAVDNFYSTYNTAAPASVVYVKNRRMVEEALGFDKGEMPDWLYDRVKEEAKESGAYLVNIQHDKEDGTAESWRRILIFAKDDINMSADVDRIVFHENVHGFALDNPHWIELGKWLAETDNKTIQRVVGWIKDAYKKESWADEMLSDYVGRMLSIGKGQMALNLIPDEYKPILNEIYEKFGYNPEQEDGRRSAEVVRDAEELQMRNTELEGTSESGDTRFKSAITPEVRREMDVISAQAIVDGTYLKAPNGEDTKLTPDQWALVRTKNFIKWFGDWTKITRNEDGSWNIPEGVSHVIEQETGEPMVVYHGTAGTLETFEDQQRSPGFWFVDREDVANGYAESAASEFREDKNIISVFLNLKNPRIENAYAEYPAEFALKSFVENDNGVYEVFDTYDEAEAYRVANVPDGWVGAAEVGDQHDLVERAKELGHDGVIMLNMHDQAAYAVTRVKGTQTNYVVLDANQIKSATDNTGEFSESEDIRFKAKRKSYGMHNKYGQKDDYTQDFLDNVYHRVLSKYHFGKDSSPYVYMDGYLMRLDVPDTEHLKYYRNVDKTDGFGVRFGIFVGDLTEEEFNKIIDDYERGLSQVTESFGELLDTYSQGWRSENASDNVLIKNRRAGIDNNGIHRETQKQAVRRGAFVRRSNSYLRASEIDTDISPISRINLQPTSEENILFKAAQSPIDAETIEVDELVEKGKQFVEKENKESVDVFMDRIRRINGNLMQLRMAASAQREYDQKTVGIITSIAKDLLDGGKLSNLTRGEIKRLLGIINNTTGKADLTKSANRLMDLMIANQLRMLKDSFAKFLRVRGKKVDSRGVEVQGQLDIPGQLVMDTVRTYVDKSLDKIEDRIALVQDKLTSDSESERRNAEYELAGLNIAKQYVENITESKYEEDLLKQEKKDTEKEFKDGKIDGGMYRALVENLNNAIQENRIERVLAYQRLIDDLAQMATKSIQGARLLKEREAQRVQQIQHYANSDMQGMPANEHDIPNKRFWNSSIIRFVLSPLATFDQMLRQFGSKSPSGEGYLWNHFMRKWLTSTEQEYKGVQSAHDKLDSQARAIFGGRVTRWSDLFARSRKTLPIKVTFWEDGGMKEHILTVGNALYIYMANKMTDGKMKLRRMGISEEDVATIAESIDPNLIGLADWIQESFLPELRDKYNAVHERLFGAPMAAIDNYFPLKVNPRARARDVDMGVAETEAKPSTITGSIIKRTRNSLALDIMHVDALDLVLEHIQQMEHWAAFAEFNQDLNTLLSYRKFRTRVENMSGIYGSGTEVWKTFRKAAELAAGVYQPASQKAALDKAAVNIAKGVTGAKISFRVYTALKQLLSMPAFISDARIDILAKNLATPWVAWNWCMENLPLFEKRWKSRQAGDSRLMATESDWSVWKNNIVETAGRLGMSPNAFIDAFTVAVGARSIYETRKKQYLDNGYSESEADTRAKQDATVLFNESQQSNESAFLSAVQVDRTAASVAFTVFRNSAMGYQRMFVDALRNLKHKLRKGNKEQSIEFIKKQLIRDGVEESKAERAATRIYGRSFFKDAMRVATFGFVVEFAWNLGSYLPYLLVGDDDDEKKAMAEDAAIHALVGGPVEGLVPGSIISEMANMVAQGEDFKNYNPTLLPIISDIKKVIEMFSYDEVAAANEVLNLLIQSGVGVNPQTFTDVAVAIYDACNGDLETTKEVTLALMRILQAPQSQVDKILADEINFKEDKGLEQTISEFAERYAKYKVLRGTPLTGWMYNDEAEKKREDSYIKRFLKSAEEMKRTRGNEDAKKYYEYLDTDYKEASETLNELKRKSKDAAMMGDKIGSMEYAKMLDDFMKTDLFKRYVEFGGYAKAIERIRDKLLKVDVETREMLEDVMLDIRKDMLEEMEKANR